MTNMQIRPDVKKRLDRYKVLSSMSYSDLLGLLVDVVEFEFKSTEGVRRKVLEALVRGPKGSG